eukprot:g5961.t1
MGRIENVDDMKPSKIRRELTDRGFKPEEILREKLKELIQKEPSNGNNVEKGSPSNQVFTRSQAKETSDQQEHKKIIEETAKDLLRLKEISVDIPYNKDLNEAPNEASNDGQCYDVEKILDVRTKGKKRKKRQYYVRWSGYTSNDDLWIDESNLDLPIEEYALSDKVKRKING